MRPILISGHERALTQVKYSADGDLIFSTSKDHVINAWFSANGERLGTYRGHQGALWTVSIDPTTTILASGAADNTIKLWNIQTGKCLKTYNFPTAIKRVDFSEDGRMLLGVTEKRMGHLGSIVVIPIEIDVDAEQADEPDVVITLEGSKATVAGFASLGEYVIAAHEDGHLSQWDPKTGDHIFTTKEPVHTEPPTDMQFSPDRTYFITSSKDKTAKLHASFTLETMKTYVTDTPLNSAAITPRTDYVVLGGGQAAMDVTTTAARQGKFEARIYHKVFEEEIGRVRGHFGPLNTVAVHPKGIGYASGGEDGYVRVHAFDRSYFGFKYEVEKEVVDGAGQHQNGVVGVKG